MDYLIAAGISLLIAVAIAIPWTRAIEKQDKDPDGKNTRTTRTTGTGPKIAEREVTPII